MRLGKCELWGSGDTLQLGPQEYSAVWHGGDVVGMVGHCGKLQGYAAVGMPAILGSCIFFGWVLHAGRGEHGPLKI